MKNFSAAFLFLLSVCHLLQAQITVNQNDFANAGETVYVNRANVPLGLNFSATGANFTWNFSQLRNNGQEQIDYRTVGSTGVVYSLYYLDIFLNPNRANMALEGSDIPFNQLLGVANPYTFYFKNNNEFRKVGYGGELLGAPVPINLNNNDVIYRFPMNFGNSHTSFSDYDISVPGLPAVSYSQRRETVVDGWGTLTTPYGTFSVLRTKSEIFGRDSVSLGIAIPRVKVTEYKWIAKNEDVPILQINTTTVLGIETIDEIFFKDRKMGVVVNAINGSVCPGAQVTVNYTKSGTYNPSAFLQAGNQFRAQLSNSSGSFASPVQIGSVIATNSGTINATIPANTQPGSNYYLRIVTTSPQVVGDTFGPFTVHPNPTATITAVGPTTVCANQTVTLNGNIGPFQYQWNRGGTPIPNATSNSINANVSGAYTLSTSNFCGTATSSAVNITVRPEPVHTLNPSSLSTCNGSPIVINSVFGAGVGPFTYRWFYNGDTIVGATAPNVTAPFTGQYELLVRDNIGCPFKTPPLPLRVDSIDIPKVNVVTNSLQVGKWVFVCPDDTVRLQTNLVAGHNYRWQRNGVDIPGAVNPVLNVTAGGNYRVVVADTCDTEISDTVKVATVARPVHEVLASANAVCLGATVSLTADNISSSTPVLFRWFESGNAIAGQAADNLVVSAPGNYSVEVVDEFGCLYRSPEKVIGSGNATPPMIYTSGDTSFCQGENLLLTTDTTAVLSFQWNLAGAPIPNAVSSSFAANVAGAYSLTTSSVCGLLTSSVLNINVLPEPEHTLNAPATSSCDGSPLAVNAVSTSGQSLFVYQWLLNGDTIAGATASAIAAPSTGQYELLVKDNNGCAFKTASISLTVDSMAKPAVSFVTPSLSVGNSVFVCPDDSLVLQTPNVAGYTYRWQRNGVDIVGANTSSLLVTANGNYTVVVADVCDSEISDTIKVINVSRPVHSIQASSTTSCDGSPINLTAVNVSSSSPISYQWFEGGNVIAGQLTDALTATATGNYAVEVVDAFGCVYLSPATPVAIVNGTPPQVNTLGNTTICAGDALTLSTDTNALFTYQWQQNNAPVGGATQATFSPAASGDYTVVVTVGGACTFTSAAVPVSVNPSPAQPQLSQSGDSVIASPAAAYQWFFEGNPVAGANEFFLQPTQSGTYTLVITDASGCTAATTIFFVKTEVGIDEPGAVWQFSVYPNPFSDKFFISSDGGLQSVKLYEPGGRLLLQHQSEMPFHQHSINAEELPAGMYVLLITSNSGASRTVKVMKY